MSRISIIVSESERQIPNDKNFIYKFSFLLVGIVTLSFYLIMEGVNVVDNLSMPYEERVDLVSLEMVEREINGNSINLAVLEDDFSELASLDLKDIVPFETPAKEVHESKVSKVPSVKKDKKRRVLITSQSGSSISFIKKKFYATNNANFSIKLAQKFYNSKKYEKALKWSLITNEIDAKSEKSWIMFAKIKSKMGKKQDAINALNHYLKYEKSKKATLLLKEIKKSV